MIQKIREHLFLVLALIWALLWILPWAIWLNSLPWISLGIAITVFAVPGMALSLILAGKHLTLPSHFTSGLALSVFFVGSLGFLGRVFHLPFEFIKPVFALAGLVAFIVLDKHSRSEHQLYKPKKFSIVTLILLLLMIAFGVTVSLLYRFFSDDLSYLTYITNWQHAQPLNFQEVIFDTGGVDSIRFWLAMFPMNLAFLAQISNLHGLLLIGLYLEPYLVAIALLATYNLYEDLFQSERLTIAALLLQFTFLVLRDATHTGTIFSSHLSQDKIFAAFVLAPIFFLAIRYFLESFNLRSGIFALLIGLSLTLTHPVILAFSIFIAGVYISIVTLAKKEYKKLGVIVVLLAVIILPAASTRVMQLPWVSRFIPVLNTMNTKVAFDLESALDTNNISQRITHIEGTPFYGFNLAVIKIRTRTTAAENPLQVFFSWSYIWILGLGFLWSLFNLQKNSIAPFIAATSLLVLLSAIPYTGWLVGYFVSARLLFRSSWMLPLGLIDVVLLAELLKFIWHKISTYSQTKISAEQVAFGLILTISLVSISYFYGFRIYFGEWQTLATIGDYQYRLEKLAALGDYLENHIQSPSIFAAQAGLMNYLPGLSSKSKVVFFRLPQFAPDPVNTGKVNRIFSPDASISIEQRTDILKEYNIQYIVFQSNVLKDYYAKSPLFFDIQKAGNFWILEFLGAGL